MQLLNNLARSFSLARASKEYMRIKDYSCRKLTLSNRNEALHLLTDGYMANPVYQAIIKKYPSLDSSYVSLKKYFNNIIDEPLSNELSMGIFDTQQNDKLIAIGINVDSAFQSKQFGESFKMIEQMSLPLKMQIYRIKCLNKLIYQKHSFLFDNQKPRQTMKAVLGVVDKKYQTSKLSVHIMQVSEMLARQAKFKYITFNSVHIASKKLGDKLGFERPCQLNQKLISFTNAQNILEYPYSQIEDAHKIVSFHWKQL